MSVSPTVRTTATRSVGPLLLALATACSDDSSNPQPEGTSTEPLYAMMVQVLTPDSEDRTVYVVLTNSLDPSSVSLDGAREFPGVANFAAAGGRLLVSSGEAPRIDSFRISDQFVWESGPSIGFSDYGLSEDGANFFNQWLVDDETAYLSFDISRRIIWNPSAMTITEVKEHSEVPLTRDGLLTEPGGNRAGVRYDGPVLQPFFYHDEDWLEFAAASTIAVYDPASHEETALLEAPCPGLAVATGAEDGTTYFSSWDYSPGRALYGLAPPPCVARVLPDRSLDEDFTTDLTEMTDGRLSINFRYLAGEKGIGEVLHHEDIDLDFEGAYDPAVEDAVWDGGHFRLWSFDLESRVAGPVDGIEAGSAGFQVARVDDRTFLFVHYEGGGRTIAYEFFDEGGLVERFRVSGEIFKWVRVR